MLAIITGVTMTIRKCRGPVGAGGDGVAFGAGAEGLISAEIAMEGVPRRSIQGVSIGWKC